MDESSGDSFAQRGTHETHIDAHHTPTDTSSCVCMSVAYLEQVLNKLNQVEQVEENEEIQPNRSNFYTQNK